MNPELLASIAALIGSRSADAIVIESGQNSRILDFGDLIVRIPRHAEAEAALRREAGLLSRVRPALPIAVPDIRIVYSEVGLIAIHPRLAGEPFHSLDGFSDDDQDQMARDLVSFLQTLHALPLTIVGDGQREDGWRELADRLKSDVLPRLSPTTGTVIDGAFRRFAEQAADVPAAVIHGDFGTGNILATDNRVTGVIDFAGCSIGDPAYDLASLSAGLGDRFLSQMQPHYPGLAAMAERIHFYRLTFPLLDILFGLDHGSEATLTEGIAGAERLFAANAG
jgi:aminoglycoside 2''-phosphotransferase